MTIKNKVYFNTCVHNIKLTSANFTGRIGFDYCSIADISGGGVVASERVRRNGRTTMDVDLIAKQTSLYKNIRKARLREHHAHLLIKINSILLQVELKMLSNC